MHFFFSIFGTEPGYGPFCMDITIAMHPVYRAYLGTHRCQ